MKEAKKVFDKIVINPAFYGSILGAVAGGGTGFQIAHKNKKSYSTEIYYGSCIGCIIGSSLALLIDLSLIRPRYIE